MDFFDILFYFLCGTVCVFELNVTLYAVQMIFMTLNPTSVLSQNRSLG